MVKEKLKLLELTEEEMEQISKIDTEKRYYHATEENLKFYASMPSDSTINAWTDSLK